MLPRARALHAAVRRGSRVAGPRAGGADGTDADGTHAAAAAAYFWRRRALGGGAPGAGDATGAAVAAPAVPAGDGTPEWEHKQPQLQQQQRRRRRRMPTGDAHVLTPAAAITRRGGDARGDLAIAAVLSDKCGVLRRAQRQGGTTVPRMLGELLADVEELEQTGHPLGPRSVQIVLQHLAALGLVAAVDRLAAHYLPRLPDAPNLPVLHEAVLQARCRNATTPHADVVQRLLDTPRLLRTRGMFSMVTARLVRDGAADPALLAAVRAAQRDQAGAGGPVSSACSDFENAALLPGVATYAEGRERFESIRAPSAKTRASFLQACCRTSVDEGRVAYRELYVRAGVEPDAAVFGILMGMFRAAADFAGMVRVYHEAHRRRQAGPAVMAMILKHCRDHVAAPGDEFHTLAQTVVDRAPAHNYFVRALHVVVLAKVGDTDAAWRLYAHVTTHNKKLRKQMDEDLAAAGVDLYAKKQPPRSSPPRPPLDAPRGGHAMNEMHATVVA